MTSSPTLSAKVISRTATVCFFTPFVVLGIDFISARLFRYNETCFFIESFLLFVFFVSFLGSLVFSLIQFEQAMKSEGNRRFLRGGLIKFFVTLGILLIGIFLPLLGASHDSIMELCQRASAKELTFALKQYEADHGELPPIRTGSEPDENGIYPHSWRVYILPYLECGNLFEQIRLNEPWDSEWNRQFHSQMPSYFAELQLPDWLITEGQTSFCLLTPLKAQKTADLGENASRTVLLAESHPGCWMDPNHDIDPTRGMGRFRSFTPTRTYFFGMYDGSIRTVKGDALTPRDWEKILNGEFDFDEK